MTERLPRSFLKIFESVVPIIETNQLVFKIESKVLSLTVYVDLQLNVVHPLDVCMTVQKVLCIVV